MTKGVLQMIRAICFALLNLISLPIQAVHLSKDGTGQVLIFPYYTVNGGQDTLINLVNTTGDTKALRVRFREAANSREVFAFNVYLGAHDVWSGGVVNGNDDIPWILSFDQSCAFPNMSFSSNTKFYDDKFTGEFSDSYSEYSYRMNEGFVEVLEMGVMTGASAEAVKIEDGIAIDCSMIENAWGPEGYWSENAATDMLPPTGGITGNITLINVAEGYAITQEPTVFENFSDVILNYNIDNDSPSLADGSLNAQIEHDGILLDTHWPTGYQAISALLMKKTISNEFVLTDGIAADTDWVLTMPTRQYHIDSRYSESVTPVAPFEEDDYSCEPYVFDYRDREAQLPEELVGSGVPLPPPAYIPPPKGLCFSANSIVMFDGGAYIEPPYGIFSSHLVPDNGDFDETSVLIETVADPNIPTYFSTGWMNLSFEQTTLLLNHNGNMTFEGMPVIGFAAQRYENHNVSGGRLANYEGIFPHKYASVITHNYTPDKNKAMQIAQDNKGQVLLLPYYTVKNGLNTLISVVNTTDEVKALKVRFLEGKNSRNVLDFNVYIDAYDVWTAGLVPHQSTITDHLEEPSVKLITLDNSCTTIFSDEQTVINSQAFIPDAFTGEFEDGLGINMTRVQEGSIEIFEMGSLKAGDAIAATHDDTGVPNNCLVLIDNWTPPTGKWIQNPNNNLTAPDGSGGLYASVSLIDIARGVDLTYDATAIENFTTEINHTPPRDIAPNLSTGNINKTRITTDDGTVKTTWPSSINAVTALFMQSEVSNDYVTEPNINAQTDWVNFYPTRPFYTDPLFSGSEVNLAPFAHLDIPLVEGDCKSFIFKAYNRDQQVSLFSGPIPPGIFPPAQHCWGVNTASVNNLDSLETIFASELQMPNWFSQYHSIYEIEFVSGWMKNTYNNNFQNAPYVDSLIGVGENGETHEIFGLPVLGFTAQRYINNNALPGVIANYAVIQVNKGKRKITITAQQ